MGVDKKGTEFYQISLGGSADEHASLGDITGRAFTEDTIVDAIETLVETYVGLRHADERFIETYRRVGLTRSRNVFMPNSKKLIIDGAESSDIWHFVDDETPLAEAPAIISLSAFARRRRRTCCRRQKLGVILRAGEKQGEDVHALKPFLDNLAVVAIEFPVYRNGRGYSTARILREQMGFRGEIRAVGEVLFDQWQFMHRCGINAFESTPMSRSKPLTKPWTS